MAVLLWVQRRFPDGTTQGVARLYPTGRVVAKAEREQAERLDDFLRERMPAIAQELSTLGLLGTNTLSKWHALGQRLAFVNEPHIVSAHDRDSGAVWLAVRQHCPPELLPTGEERLTPDRMSKALESMENQRRLGKRHDHFERCYKLGKYAVRDVDWLTWSDFDAFLESPGLERESRILAMMRGRVRALGRQLTRSEFRMVCKTLREAIPTKQRQRDTSGLAEDELGRLVDHAFKNAGLDVREPR